jgi:membrane protein implicated in regulation of membrane protease activity
MSDHFRALQVLCATLMAWSYQSYRFAIVVLLVLMALAPWRGDD